MAVVVVCDLDETLVHTTPVLQLLRDAACGEDGKHAALLAAGCINVPAVKAVAALKAEGYRVGLYTDADTSDSAVDSIINCVQLIGGFEFNWKEGGNSEGKSLLHIREKWCAGNDHIIMFDDRPLGAIDTSLNTEHVRVHPFVPRLTLSVRQFAERVCGEFTPRMYYAALRFWANDQRRYIDEYYNHPHQPVVTATQWEACVRDFERAQLPHSTRYT
jgi:hypothetical protein